MRIARVVQYFQPKLGYTEYYLMTQFKREGHEVLIITSDHYSSPGTSVFDNGVDPKVHSGRSVEYGLSVYRLPTFFKSGDLIINRLGIKKILEDFKPDVVHSNDLFYLPTISALQHKEGLGYKMFVDSITGTFHPSAIDSVILNLYRFLLGRYLCKSVNGFFAICEGSRKWLSKNFRIPENRISVIPLGADSELFAPVSTTRRMMRRKLGILDDEVALIYTGKILPEKDVDLLIRSASMLLHDFSRKVKVIIVGSGPRNYLEYLLRIVRLSDMRQNIIFIPTVDRNELPKYYNAADIAIWPGAPSISMIEAMSTGLPLIIAGYARPREDAYDTAHLLEYGNGRSFVRGDILDLAKQIELLTTSENLRKEMGQNSRKLVEDRLNWSCIAQKYLSVYRSTLNE